MKFSKKHVKYYAIERLPDMRTTSKEYFHARKESYNLIKLPFLET